MPVHKNKNRKNRTLNKKRVKIVKRLKEQTSVIRRQQRHIKAKDTYTRIHVQQNQLQIKYRYTFFRIMALVVFAENVF